MTVAILTVHAFLAVENYSIILNNGPARADGTALKVQEAGGNIGIMFVRNEDWDKKGKSGKFVSVLQCNYASIIRTPRVYQMQGAFIHDALQVRRLDQHMRSSKHPGHCWRLSHLETFLL